MIVKRCWHAPRKRNLKIYDYVGVFLFGFIPLYIYRSDYR